MHSLAQTVSQPARHTSPITFPLKIEYIFHIYVCIKCEQFFFFYHGRLALYSHIDLRIPPLDFGFTCDSFLFLQLFSSKRIISSRNDSFAKPLLRFTFLRSVDSISVRFETIAWNMISQLGPSIRCAYMSLWVCECVSVCHLSHFNFMLNAHPASVVINIFIGMKNRLPSHKRKSYFNWQKVFDWLDFRIFRSTHLHIPSKSQRFFFQQIFPACKKPLWMPMKKFICKSVPIFNDFSILIFFFCSPN